MNQLNDLHGDEPIETQIAWNSQPPAAHFKSRTYPTQTIPVVTAITGKISHHAIDNGDIEVQPSEFPFEYISESVPDTYTTTIK